MSRQAPDLKLGQSPLPSQRVLLLIAGIIDGRPVLDISLTPPRELYGYVDKAVGGLPSFGQVSGLIL